MSTVENEFQTQELTCSIFSYTLAQFEELQTAEAVQMWEDDLNDNSCSYPLLVQSPFNEYGLNLSTSIDEEPKSKTVYVVPHYFYTTADYEIEEPIDGTYTAILAPIVGTLFEGRPMEFFERDGDQIYPELAGASDATDFAISFYWGSEFAGSFALADVNDDILADIAKKFT